MVDSFVSTAGHQRCRQSNAATQMAGGNTSQFLSNCYKEREMALSVDSPAPWMNGWLPTHCVPTGNVIQCGFRTRDNWEARCQPSTGTCSSRLKPLKLERSVTSRHVEGRSYKSRKFSIVQRMPHLCVLVGVGRSSQSLAHNKADTSCSCVDAYGEFL